MPRPMLDYGLIVITNGVFLNEICLVKKRKWSHEMGMLHVVGLVCLDKDGKTLCLITDACMHAVVPARTPPLPREM
jgi:hypothetical protein